MRHCTNNTVVIGFDNLIEAPKPVQFTWGGLGLPG